MEDGLRDKLGEFFRRYGLYFVLVALALGFVFLPDADLLGGGEVYVDVGYDDQGKYLLLVPEEGGTLEELKLDGELVAEGVWVPATGLKVRYPWRSGATYRVEAELDSGGTREDLEAPEVEGSLGIESALPYRNATLARLHALEHDRVAVYPADSVPGEVYLLDYPPVSQSDEGYREYVSRLSRYLDMAGIDFRYLRSPELVRGAVTVMATGGLPADEGYVKRLKEGDGRAIYIGVMPGSVVVTPEGNVDTGNVFGGVTPSRAGVESGKVRMEESAYTTTLSDSALAERDDGRPAVFRVGGLKIFSATIDRGWKVPGDAAWDTFLALLSADDVPTPVREFEPGGDVLNALVEVPASAEELVLVARGEGGEVSAIKREGVPAAGATLDASVVLLDEQLPGEREAVVRVVSEKAGGEARLVATNLESGAARVTELGSVKEGKNIFRKGVALPPGEVLLTVESGGRLSEATRLEVRELSALAEPIEGGYMVRVYVGDEPYSGEVTVATPEKGRGEVSIEGALRVTDDSFKLYSGGYRIPVSYKAPDSGLGLPLLPVAVAVLAILVAVPLLTRRRGEGKIRLVFELPREREEDIVTASKVISAFTKYNRFRGVDYFPLSLTELKHALSLFVTSGVTPTAGVVKELVGKMEGLRKPLRVKGSYGYYAPAAWEGETKQSVEHLAMIRATYEYAVRHGYFAEVIMEKVSPDAKGKPDLLLNKRDGGVVVYVEVLSSVRKRQLETDLGKHVRTVESLRKVDREKGFGYVAALWLVLPAELYRACRRALREGRWKKGPLIEALEREGKLKILNIDALLG